MSGRGKPVCAGLEHPHGVIGCYREIKTAVRDIGLFIEGSEHVIRDHLRARS